MKAAQGQKRFDYSEWQQRISCDSWFLPTGLGENILEEHLFTANRARVRREGFMLTCTVLFGSPQSCKIFATKLWCDEILKWFLNYLWCSIISRHVSPPLQSSPGMSRKQDKPLPAPPPPQRDPPPPPPPERPPPIPPESRHSWLPSPSPLSSCISSSTGALSDSQMHPETRCPKDSHLSDAHRTDAEHLLQLGPAGPSHGRPLSCPSAEFGRLHHRMEGAGNSESSKVGFSF